MRQRLEALLAVQLDAEKLFQEGTPDREVCQRFSISITKSIGPRIDRYRLREKISEDGCGVVYVAVKLDWDRFSVARLGRLWPGRSPGRLTRIAIVAGPTCGRVLGMCLALALGSLVFRR